MRTLFMAVLGVALVATPRTFGQEPPKVDWLYRISVISVVASSAADGATSIGAIERNRLLASSNGTFSYRGAAIKAGLTTGFLASNRAMYTKCTVRKRRWLAVANFGAAALYGAVAVHNARLRR